MISLLCRKLEVAPIFGDRMVLQRDVEIPVWGRARPGAEVSVALAKRQASCRVDRTGRWSLRLPCLPAGGPYELSVRSGSRVLVLKDVMIGEVWLCSGQSNMEMTLNLWQGVDPPEVAEALDPDLRLFTVSRATAFRPGETCGGRWERCVPDTARHFSAVACHFGSALRKKFSVPVGLVVSAWGGTVVEAWTSRESLASEPEFAYLLAKADRRAAGKDGDAEKVRAWELATYAQDEGIARGCRSWMKKDFNDTDWESMPVPGAWERQGLLIDGAVWFRCSVEIPADWPKGDLTLDLGAVDDFDRTYANGVLIGLTGAETPNHWIFHRRYRIPARLVRPGRRISLAVRVFDRIAEGGLMGPAEAMKISSVADPSRSIPLPQRWQYRVEKAFPEKEGDVWKTYPQGTEIQNTPTVLFNAMIAPLVPFAFRGVIWYQGESNAERAFQYRKLFPLMIRDWRRVWGRELPFFFVQLANFMERKDGPVESAWAELREAQSRTLFLPATGMAVIADIGEAGDIHPKNKKDVGLRLFLQALEKCYGERIVSSGPVFREMRVESGKIRLFFDSVGGGLEVRNAERLVGFTLAEENAPFVLADAVIEGETVLVSHPSVREPADLRYAWEDNPLLTLYNREGLPASPFRTDRRKGLTEGCL